MGSKMLIDATHAEETRVVVVRGNRIEEFDFESAARKQLICGFAVDSNCNSGCSGCKDCDGELAT